jgi:glycosyltransferase involved in cell wall biosynthesis
VTIAVITTDKGAEESDEDLLALCPVHVAHARPPYSWTFAPGVILPIWRAVSGADVVHIHSVHTFPSTVAMIIARLRRKPYILEPHGALDRYHRDQGAAKKRMYTALLDGWGLGKLGGVVYSSRREAREGSEVLRAPAIFMPLGVDEALFDLPRKDDRSGQVNVLYLGRLAKKKRVDLVIRSLAEPPLANLDINLVVAGPTGDDLPYDPHDIAINVGVERRVRFVGSVDAAERRALLAAADVFVIPSEDESFGVALAEAMAAGCAPVATRETGFAAEAAEHGALALAELTPSGVAQATAEAVHRRDELARAAREYASERFRWREAASALCDAYTEVARTDRART